MFILLLSTLACGSGAPNIKEPSVETIVASTLSAYTAQAVVTEVPATEPASNITPEGEIATYGDITFIMPNGMASDATAVLSNDIELPYWGTSSDAMPPHVKFTLKNYPLQGTTIQPEVIIFKADEYAQYGKIDAALIATLKDLQYTDGQPVPDELPTGEAYTAQIHGITFKNGKGIRYLTQFDQGVMPANNQQMFYYFLGITNDGLYYVEATLPVNAPFLIADGNINSTLPVDGIPFTASIPYNWDELHQYYQTVTDKLNATDDFNFTPYLPQLDFMMESLTINGL